jgi:hypothetical protein
VALQTLATAPPKPPPSLPCRHQSEPPVQPVRLAGMAAAWLVFSLSMVGGFTLGHQLVLEDDEFNEVGGGSSAWWSIRRPTREIMVIVGWIWLFPLVEVRQSLPAAQRCVRPLVVDGGCVQQSPLPFPFWRSCGSHRWPKVVRVVTLHGVVAVVGGRRQCAWSLFAAVALAVVCTRRKGTTSSDVAALLHQWSFGGRSRMG